MAGDIGMNERCIVLPTGGAAEFAAAVLPRARPGVRHIYGPRLVVAAVDGDGGRAPEAEAEAVSAETRRQLTEAELLGLDAFNMRRSQSYARAKAARPHDGADWDSGRAEAPACGDITAAHAARAERVRTGEAQGRAETSARLDGSVAVGIVIVEGPTDALKFTEAERTKVVAEVQNGLGWLGGQNPAGVSWVYDIRVVTLDVAPGAADLGSEQKEALWRDPAMAKLGFGAGLGGVTQYVESLRGRLRTKWGYCAFFTKYPIYHFAYASIGGPRVVMDYANDGWGPDNIDRVFAHETGHIFGAPDEYAASGCDCGGSWGAHGKPNLNCANCAPSGGVDCLMKQNSWAMCPHTPYHLGFPLIEQSYSGVWRQGTDAHHLWVNANWTNFLAKYNELAGKGLRLVEFKITQEGAEDRFHGIWRQGSDAHAIWVNAGQDAFIAKFNEFSQQGQRLVDLKVTNRGGQLRYSGAWRQGTDAHYLWVNADWTNFLAKYNELAGKGLRLNDLCIVEVGGQQRFCGAWRAGTGGHYIWVNATWDNFLAKYNELAAQGLRLVDVQITGASAQRRYSGVWLPGNDAHYLWVNANWQAFEAKFRELSDKGLRMVALDVVPASGPMSPRPGAEMAGRAAPENRMADALAGFAPTAEGTDSEPGCGTGTPAVALGAHDPADGGAGAGDGPGFGVGDLGPGGEAPRGGGGEGFGLGDFGPLDETSGGGAKGVGAGDLGSGGPVHGAETGAGFGAGSYT